MLLFCLRLNEMRREDPLERLKIEIRNTIIISLKKRTTARCFYKAVFPFHNMRKDNFFGVFHVNSSAKYLEDFMNEMKIQFSKKSLEDFTKIGQFAQFRVVLY